MSLSRVHSETDVGGPWGCFSSWCVHVEIAGVGVRPGNASPKNLSDARRTASRHRMGGCSGDARWRIGAPCTSGSHAGADLGFIWALSGVHLGPIQGRGEAAAGFMGADAVLGHLFRCRWLDEDRSHARKIWGCRGAPTRAERGRSRTRPEMGSAVAANYSVPKRSPIVNSLRWSSMRRGTPRAPSSDAPLRPPRASPWNWTNISATGAHLREQADPLHRRSQRPRPRLRSPCQSAQSHKPPSHPEAMPPNCLPLAQRWPQLPLRGAGVPGTPGRKKHRSARMWSRGGDGNPRLCRTCLWSSRRRSIDDAHRPVVVTSTTPLSDLQ